MRVAQELDVTPWEALLKSVRLAAGRVAWVDAQLERAVTESTTGANDGGEPVNAQVDYWLTASRKERTLLARMAKAAVDAGVAERMVRQTEFEGKIIAEVLGRVIDTLPLGIDDRVRAFEEAHRQLLVLEAPEGVPRGGESTRTAFGDGDASGGGPHPQGGPEGPQPHRDDDAG